MLKELHESKKSTANKYLKAVTMAKVGFEKKIGDRELLEGQNWLYNKNFLQKIAREHMGNVVFEKFLRTMLKNGYFLRKFYKKINSFFAFTAKNVNMCAFFIEIFQK